MKNLEQGMSNGNSRDSRGFISLSTFGRRHLYLKNNVNWHVQM
jgi:hypothetical protein